MSRHNKDRRKYRCVCGNPFSTKQVDDVEAAFAHQKSTGVILPDFLPHSCGRCKRISCLDGGKFRYLTPAEELKYRIDFPQAAAMNDWAIKTDAPDCIAMIPLPKEGGS